MFVSVADYEVTCSLRHGSAAAYGVAHSADRFAVYKKARTAFRKLSLMRTMHQTTVRSVFIAHQYNGLDSESDKIIPVRKEMSLTEMESEDTID